MDTSSPVRFYHRGSIVEVSDAHPTRSVLDWLRESARCIGTKEGCGEGDCGACTVVVAELPTPTSPVGSLVRGLSLRSVNACIQFLPTLDGKALFTVEDLKQPDGTLHPVQQAMVDCHASQCGFCTPGFVMSLWSTHERHCERGTVPTRQQLADDLSGNLCRCTGYRPIIDAGLHMFDIAAPGLDTAPVIAALTSIAPAGEAFDYSAPHPSAPHDAHGRAPQHHFHAPRTVEALAARLEAAPQSRILAGSTDIGLWVNKGFRTLPELVFIGEVDAMKGVTPNDDGSLTIGAGASLEAAWQAICQRHPSLTDIWLRFASLPIRNAGTMGGNVANGSPIGDSLPILMALDADVVLRKGSRERRMPLTDFYVDYMKNRLEPGEFVLGLELPALPAARQIRGYKISKRFDCDISALCTGFAVELDGDVVREVRLAFGGMAAIVKRAAKAEAAMLGQPWNEVTLRMAQAALADDFKPLTDLRASKDYRAQVARNLLEQLWLETRPAKPLAATQTSVFASLVHHIA